jgi:hypothetical protein
LVSGHAVSAVLVRSSNSPTVMDGRAPVVTFDDVALMRSSPRSGRRVRVRQTAGRQSRAGIASTSQLARRFDFVVG